jgi:hypothetical protein
MGQVPPAYHLPRPPSIVTSAAASILPEQERDDQPLDRPAERIYNAALPAEAPFFWVDPNALGAQVIALSGQEKTDHDRARRRELDLPRYRSL